MASVGSKPPKDKNEYATTEEQRQAALEYYKRNKEKIRKHHAKREVKEQRRANARRYRERHLKELREYNREYCRKRRKKRSDSGTIKSEER